MAMAIAIQGANRNMCDWIVCANDGLCQEVENSTIGYKCRCQVGFTGMLCESRVNITICLNNPCKNNGNCTITSDRLIKCACQKQYTGARCETSIGNKMN